MMESSLRILVLCLAAAFVCASLRTVHPQIAGAVALACGVAVVMLSLDDFASLSEALSELEAYAAQDHQHQLKLIKTCGIAMIAEFASDICRDANELALSRRIDMAVKLGIVVSALPMAGEIMKQIADMMV